MAIDPNITRTSTMRDVVLAYPGAQRAIFRRFHIGGCDACGYQPEDTLETVAARRGVEVDQIIALFQQTAASDRSLEVSPKAVAALLHSHQAPRLIDVRSPREWELARIEGAELVGEELAVQMMRWSRRTHVVFFSHYGQRSLDAASYLAGHGFNDVRSMTGGIDAWSLEVDPNVPRYETLAASPRNASIHPLRAVVSQARGCRK